MSIDRHLLQVIAAIRDPDELAQFFKDLFTPAELADISLRWKLLADLHQGMPQRKIARKYGISLCKITRGSRVLKKKEGVVGRLLAQLPDPSDK